MNKNLLNGSKQEMRDYVLCVSINPFHKGKFIKSVLKCNVLPLKTVFLPGR